MYIEDNTFNEKMLLHSFPEEVVEDVIIVASSLPQELYKTNSKFGADKSLCRYTLMNGEKISFPYRIYGIEKLEVPSFFTFTQNLIFHAFLSRSDKGIIREEHIRAILEEDYPDWIFPYIIKLSDEYVIEILDVIYYYLSRQNCKNIQHFCKLNLQSFKRSYSRMVSYWNEYYRSCMFCNYVGKKLFVDCYGYHNS